MERQVSEILAASRIRAAASAEAAASPTIPAAEVADRKTSVA
jgi:hypothetical protein